MPAFGAPEATLRARVPAIGDRGPAGDVPDRQPGSVRIPFPGKSVGTDDAVRFLAGELPVTIIITFRLREDASVDRFVALCTDIGNFMARRPGFISARLFRARGGAGFDYIQIANWTHAALLAEAQAEPGVRQIERQVESLVLFRRRVLCEASTEQLLAPNPLT